MENKLKINGRDPIDDLIIRGLKSTDESIRTVCVMRFFYRTLRRQLLFIRRKLFNYSVEYDDLVNELYLYMSKGGWSMLDTFRGENGAGLATWAGKVALHYFCSKTSLGTLPELPPAAAGEEGIDEATRNEARMDVNEIIARMPNRRYAKVIDLVFIQGYSLPETASILGVKVSNMYNIKKRAVTQFYATMTDSANIAGPGRKLR
ncbi:MAG: sigma-70 family RNA polymerase sigma factor [Candidatus Cryptobacteroides sp.]